MAKETVIVALSGGVDSSVAAALAVQAGLDVRAVTLRMTPPAGRLDGARPLCVSPEAEARARETAEKLGIRHEVLDVWEAFEEAVLRPSALAYDAGLTPNPCTLCNPAVKFGLLLRYAEQCGAARLLTGHYAKCVEENGIRYLERGSDPAKDQSYFLYRLSQKALRRIDFPLSRLTKQEVRLIAEKYGFSAARARESQDACFQVEGECFGETLHTFFQLPPKPGFFRYQGKIVGRHCGIHRYTIGQRKGLKVALGVPAFIRSIDPATGDVELVTDPVRLMTERFSVCKLSWTAGTPPASATPLLVQIRYRSRPVPCRITFAAEGVSVEPEIPLRAVTPGQAAVFYAGERLLGGGIISCTTSN